jgi:crossover junction endodeoxyribonuclease RuvC
MIIFGIDPGTNRTGWGVITKKETKKSAPHIKYIAHGCIITEKVDSMPDRLRILHNNLNGLVEKHKPDCLIVENIFFGRNVKTAMTVSQARGVIMLSAALFSLPVFEYTPSTVKLSLTGSGKTEKKGVQETVRKLLNTNSATLAFNGKKDKKDFDDSADALAIALHHAMKVF